MRSRIEPAIISDSTAATANETAGRLSLGVLRYAPGRRNEAGCRASMPAKALCTRNVKSVVPRTTSATNVAAIEYLSHCTIEGVDSVAAGNRQRSMLEHSTVTMQKKCRAGRNIIH